MNVSLKDKLLNKEELTNEEVEELVCNTPDDINWVEEIEGEDRRWSRTNLVILGVDDKYFQIEYEHGLTEYQENEYWGQVAIEVRKIEKVITTTVWEEI